MSRRDYDHTGNQNLYRGSNREHNHYRQDLESISDNQRNMNHMKRTNDRTGNRGDVNTSTCQKLADIIGGEVVQASPACVIMRLRDIKATILGRRTRSPLALPYMLSFEDNGLNLGESVVLQKEVNPMIAALQRRGIIVTAFHNHWLFEEPRLMYLHWENVGMDPVEFARKSFEAAKEARLF